jgi:ketosteroid isomerase-like protein
MHGYTYGYSEQVTPTGAVLPGKYHAFWSRQSNGTWKMEAFKRTPRTAGVVSLTPPPGFETPGNTHRRYFPNTDAAAEQSALFTVDIAFSNDAQVNVADAFAKYAAPDGAQTGNAVVPWAFGPEAIRQAWAGIPNTFYWTPEIGAAASSGDLGFTVGFVRSGNAIIGKYFTIWQKQATGEWRFVVD